MSSKRDKITKRSKKPQKLIIWIGFCTILILGIIAIALTRMNNRDLNRINNNNYTKYQKVKERDGIVKFKAADFADKKARYFHYIFPEGKVNFFVLQSSDGNIRAAFDACDVCYRSKRGYRQQNDFMICNNCGRKFQSVRINEEKGGCNPAPLNRTIVNGYVEIKVSDIRKGLGYFPL